MNCDSEPSIANRPRGAIFVELLLATFAALVLVGICLISNLDLGLDVQRPAGGHQEMGRTSNEGFAL